MPRLGNCASDRSLYNTVDFIPIIESIRHREITCNGRKRAVLVSHCPSVCPSVSGRNSAHSVLSTILLDPFRIYTIYLANAEGVSCVIFIIPKFEVLAFFFNLRLWLCFVLIWDSILWINSVGNHAAVRVFSEHRRSSCYSLVLSLRCCMQYIV